MDLIVNNKILSKGVLEILNDISMSITNGKLKTVRVSGSGAMVTCPYHSQGRENRPSCSINLTDSNIPIGFFHCFTCGEAGPFEKFVAECFDKSISWAINWLITRYSDGVLDAEEIYLPKLEINVPAQKKVEYKDESILDSFSNFHPYMKARKLSNEVIDRFKIKYDPSTRSLVFPVRDRSGNLKFFTRRSVDSKKFIIDKGADKSDIYLLDEIIKNDIKEVYVVESQINCLTLWGWGKPAIALLGAGTTEEQIAQLNKTDIRRFILCYDNDPAGLKGEKRFKSFIRKDIFVDVVRMPVGRDVNDLSLEEFNRLEKEGCQWQ